MELLGVGEEVKKILEKALHGARISAPEALRLLRTQGDELLACLLAANKIRERKAGRVVTYVVNRNINFTNICTNACKFCAFRRSKGEKGAYFLKFADVVAKAKEARKLGATEICIQGGLHPDVDVHFYANLLLAIKREVAIHIHAFSPMEVYHAAKRSGMGIEETLKYLKESGLDSMPGTAAEILNDEIRGHICPEKINTREWIEIITKAHRIGIPTTATMLYGHIETPEQQVEHLSLLREIQDKTRGFTEFVPLSFVHYNSPLYLSGKSRAGATGVEDLKLYAVSRIFLDNFRNLQASWVKLGRKFAQVMLNFGANDLGGTLMEESISRSAGLKQEMLGEEELRRMIIEAGRVPRKRDTLYNLVDKTEVVKMAEQEM